MLNDGNQIQNFKSSSGSGTVVNYDFACGSEFLTSNGSGSGPVFMLMQLPKKRKGMMQMLESSL